MTACWHLEHHIVTENADQSAVNIEELSVNVNTVHCRKRSAYCQPQFTNMRLVTQKVGFWGKWPIKGKILQFFPEGIDEIVIESRIVFKFHANRPLINSISEAFRFLTSPLIEVYRSFLGSVPSEHPSLCEISSWSVEDCQSYSRKTVFGLSQYLQKLHLSLLLYTMNCRINQI